MNSFLFDQYTYLVALVIMELMKLIVTAILFSIETFLFYLLRPLQKWVFQASHEPRLHPGFVRLLVHEFTPLTNAILPSYCTNLSMCSFIKRFQSRINLIKDHANKK